MTASPNPLAPPGSAEQLARALIAAHECQAKLLAIAAELRGLKKFWLAQQVTEAAATEGIIYRDTRRALFGGRTQLLVTMKRLTDADIIAFAREILEQAPAPSPADGR